jgi:hypothetical protein
MENQRKTHQELIDISGMGTQVKKTVMRRKNFLPQTSDSAPIRGALRNDKMPLMPITSPFMRNVWSGKVLLRTLMTGMVRRPHEKYSKKITINPWYTDGAPMPELWKEAKMFLFSQLESSAWRGRDCWLLKK